ncbi:MAG TPA: thiamine pyrophosphate-dependent enzyme [Candidatus Limnocylindrales bacterium]|nr:thiamine pyrophosphate-dependent enzyme [Candidatus Limnocylindrales bacterium]
MTEGSRFGSDVLVERLSSLGVEHIALNPGASIRGLHDSLVNPTGRAPELILALHEEIAVAIAHGYAKAGGGTMAVAVHDTVGLLHASMALFNAWADRSPILAFVGTGPLDAAHRRPWIDWIHTVTDQAALVRDFTVWNDQPTSVAALLASTDRAWSTIHREPVGPGLIALDVDVQEAAVEPGAFEAELTAAAVRASRIAPDPAVVEAIVGDLRASRAPVFITDRPLGTAASALLVELASRVGAGLLELGGGVSFPVGHPLDVTEGADAAIGAADHLLFVEVRDPTWALGTVDLESRRVETGWRRTPVASIGLAGALDKTWMVTESAGPARVDLTSDPELALAALLETWGDDRRPLDRALAEAAATPPPALPASTSDARGIHRGHVGRALAAALGGSEWTIANGLLGTWARRTLRFQRPDQFLGRSFAGGLGYGAGASIGAALALRGSGRVVVDLQGDGDFLYTPQALWTAAHHDIPLLVLIDSNRSYFQDERHQRAVARHRGRPPERVGMGITIDDPPVDHASLARSLGIAAEGPIEDYGELETALGRAVARVRSGEPVLLDVRTTPA